MDPLFATLISALITAISVMWKKLSAEYQRLSKRSDDCEQDRERIHRTLGEVKQDLAVFKACSALECPAAEALRRRETFHLKPTKKP